MQAKHEADYGHNAWFHQRFATFHALLEQDALAGKRLAEADLQRGLARKAMEKAVELATVSYFVFVFGAKTYNIDCITTNLFTFTLLGCCRQEHCAFCIRFLLRSTRRRQASCMQPPSRS